MAMEEEGEEVDLREGMPVATEEGASLGKLSALLVAEEEEEAEFLLIEHNGAERLVPFEAVLGVGDGNLVLDVPTPEILAKFPRIRDQADPTDDEMELAYQVYDENALYGDDDAEDDE
jgi:sporulation protein YlmC with PRC-barrel domain